MLDKFQAFYSTGSQLLGCRARAIGNGYAARAIAVLHGIVVIDDAKISCFTKQDFALDASKIIPCLQIAGVFLNDVCKLILCENLNLACGSPIHKAQFAMG